MAAIIRGKHHRKTFWYGIDGRAEDYPVAESPTIREKMDDETIEFTGLGCFPVHPSDEQVLARIEEIKQAVSDGSFNPEKYWEWEPKVS